MHKRPTFRGVPKSVGWSDLGSLSDHFTMCCSMPYRLPLNATHSDFCCPKLLMIFRWINYCVATGDVYVPELGLVKQRWLREVEAAASGFDYYTCVQSEEIFSYKQRDQ